MQIIEMTRGLLSSKDFAVCCTTYKSPTLSIVSPIVVVKNRQSIRDAVGKMLKPEDSGRKSPTRILIVEDRESMRDALRMWFRLRKNWEICEEAQDATEAIRKAEQLHPDLIVMDYKMQDSNGLQAADGIFKLLPHVPIVMFTLYKTDELERAAKVIGIRCVVGKEEGVHRLLSAIESELPKPAN